MLNVHTANHATYSYRQILTLIVDLLWSDLTIISEITAGLYNGKFMACFFLCSVINVSFYATKNQFDV